MSLVLPFRLKVQGEDTFRGGSAASTSFRFRGRMRLDGTLLLIQWTGSAQVQEVGILDLRDDRLDLPTETLTVPVNRLRRAALSGGWWRPRLEVSGRDLGALSLVPSEEHGTVRFRYARRDRTIAITLAAALDRAIADALIAAEEPGVITHTSEADPPTPPGTPRLPLG